MKDTRFKTVKYILTFLSSKALLLWLIGGWLMYYVASAIWMEEAFAFFVSGVEKNTLIRIPFVLFLVSGYFNLVRVFINKLKGSKVGFSAWLMLSIGVMLYFTGFFLSINFRQFDSRLVGEGHMLRLPWDMKNYRISTVTPGLKDKYKKTVSGGLLEREPKITITDSSSNIYEVGAYPPVSIEGTYVHILNYGVAPGVELYADGALTKKGYMALRLLPPGRSDYFDLQPLPYRFLVSLAPDHSDFGGHHPVPEFNLKDPVYSTRVFKGDKIIAEGDSTKAVKFDRFALAYFEPKYWVQLESARDPGILVMRLGIFLFVFGIPVYILRLAMSILSIRG
jgi:hypothetical protein